MQFKNELSIDTRLHSVFVLDILLPNYKLKVQHSHVLYVKRLWSFRLYMWIRTSFAALWEKLKLLVSEKKKITTLKKTGQQWIRWLLLIWKRERERCVFTWRWEMCWLLIWSLLLDPFGNLNLLQPRRYK